MTLEDVRRAGRHGWRRARSETGTGGTGARTRAAGSSRGARGSVALDAALAEFAELSGTLGGEVAEVNGNIEALATVLADHARLGEELRVAATEVAAGNHQVADAVERTREATATARNESAGSQQVLDEALKQLTDFVNWAGGTGEQLQSVAAAMSAITAASHRVSEIAEQTHILALNARIEAARAGVAGQGFQVIADNVRELANQTMKAASEITSTVGPLSERVNELGRQGESAQEKAASVRASTESLASTIESVTGALSLADGQVADITASTAMIAGNVDGFLSSLSALADGLGSSSHEINAARERTDTMLVVSQRLVAASARTGVRTRDTPIIEAAVATAAQIGALFSEAIARGDIRRTDLFDDDYRPIAGSDPAQFMTKFAQFTDRVLPSLQEVIPAIDDRITFAIATDRNGYIATHMAAVSKPQGADPVWNAAHCRNRRIFNDRTGLACGQNTELFLVQTYRRDMGGGTFVLMKDASAPIWVDGAHWGGFRIGYRAD